MRAWMLGCLLSAGCASKPPAEEPVHAEPGKVVTITPKALEREVMTCSAITFIYVVKA